MKKIIFVFLSVITILFVVYINTDRYIKINKVYTKDIDLDQDVNKITIDNTRIMEKTKTILSEIYGIEDFSKFRIEADFGDNIFYIYFFDNGKSGYFISYDIDKGVVVALSRLFGDNAESGKEIKSLGELEEIIRGYLSELEVSNSDNYEIIDYEYYNNYYNIRLDNKLTQSQISITTNAHTGQLIEYNHSKIYTSK